MSNREALADYQANTFSAERLEQLFASTFSEMNTRLIGGRDEPLYQPAGDEQSFHQLFYRDDYFASALHEISHWCIAGEGRRSQLDFGYWYAPDGRNSQQQRQFEAAETKPQALEWLFSIACGYRFVLSADNLTSDCTGNVESQAGSSAFAQAVYRQARRWQQQGLPPRAQRFFSALSREFETGVTLATVTLSEAGLS